MKPKLLLALALILGGQGFAAIVYPQAPEGGRAMVAKCLDPQALKFLNVARVEDLTITEPLAEYYVADLTKLSRRNFLAAAQPGEWLYLLAQGTNTVGAVGLQPDKPSGKGLKFSYLARTDATNTTLCGLRVAASLPQIRNRDYELRSFDLPPILFRSVWLHGKADDILIPLPPTFGRWNAYQPYSESQMLALLMPEVEKSRKAAKSVMPK